MNYCGMEGDEQLEFSSKVKEMVSGLGDLQKIKLPSSNDVETLDVPKQTQANSIEDIMRN